MNCFVCAAERITRPAVGVCVACGSGACLDHGEIVTVGRPTRTGNLFAERTIEARLFRCETCRALGPTAAAPARLVPSVAPTG